MYADHKMQKEVITMHQRVNITLPKETLGLIDRVAKKGDRSRFIDEAIKHYVDAVGRANLRKLLKEGAIKRTQRDLALTEEWFGIEEELWQERQR
jgi:CopG family transcriptional regulator/antitoxin EndoAI